MTGRTLFAATALGGLALPGAAVAGLTICNEGGSRISVAIGYKAAEWTSEGWWNVAPGACATVIAGDLDGQYYYYRATGAGLADPGEGYFFCTIAEAFTIAGDEDCKARGYRREDFAEIHVGQDLDYTLVIDAEHENAAPGAVSVQSGLAPGTYGEPFTMDAAMGECVFEGDFHFCAFTANGWYWQAMDDGRTPAAVMEGLAQLPPGTPVRITGDVVSYGDITVEVVARGVEEIDPDPGALALLAMQGRWQSAMDAASTLEIFGGTQYEYFDGQFFSEAILSVTGSCNGDPAGQGPLYLLITAFETQSTQCYAIDNVEGGWLDLTHVASGDQQSYRQLP